jgi:hypothetical protein
MYAWIARDLDRPRNLIDPERTETLATPAMFRLANDPQAAYARLWQEIEGYKRRKPESRVDDTLRHIHSMVN